MPLLSPRHTLPLATAALLTACQPAADLTFGHLLPADAPDRDTLATAWTLSLAGEDTHCPEFSALYRLDDGTLAMVAELGRGPELIHASPDGRLLRRQALTLADDQGTYLGRRDEALRDGDALVTTIGGRTSRIDLRTGAIAWSRPRSYRVFPLDGNLVEASWDCPGPLDIARVDPATGGSTPLLSYTGEEMHAADTARDIRTAYLVAAAGGPSAPDASLARRTPDAGTLVVLERHEPAWERWGEEPTTASLTAYELPGMEERWRREAEVGEGQLYQGAPVVVDGLLIQPFADSLRAFDLASGQWVWSFGLPRRDAAGQENYGWGLADHTLTLQEADGQATVYATGNEGSYALDARTGATRWASARGDMSYAHEGVHVLWADLLALPVHGGSLDLLEASSGRLLRTLPARGGRSVYGDPTFSYDVDAGRLFAFEGHVLYAVDDLLGGDPQ